MLHVSFCVKGWHTSQGMESVGRFVWVFFRLCKSDKGSLNFLWTFLHCSGINYRLIHSAVEEIFHFTSSHQIQILLLHIVLYPL